MPEASSDKTIPVRVAVRIRPLVPKELGEACQECVTLTPGEPQLVMGTNKAFTYDWVFGTNSTQDELYRQVALPLLDGFFKGYNATVLAYGQTGSGKTYSMGTSCTVFTSEDEESQGVIPRLIKDLFAHIEQRKDKCKFLLKVSFLEIHNEEIHDLLNPNSSDDRITIRENCEGGIKIAGLQELVVTSMQEMARCLESGSASRVTGATAMNSRSSRSHAIYTIIMEQKENGANGDIRKAKFHLVDLAGSERVKRTNAQGERFKEGVNINKGLLCLGNVISALSDEQRKSNAHVPYRDSKLTRLLQDSLGGNSNTLMLACVSPADSNYEETLNTLRYADRARQIKNKPIINRDPATAEMTRLKQQVQMLQLQLLQGQTINGSLPEGMRGENSVSMQELADRIKDLEDENKKLSHELHDSVDQNTNLYEKVLLLELKRDKMIRTFEEIKSRTGENSSVDVTENQDEGNGSLAAQLQIKLNELEKTMHAPPTTESHNNSQDEIQAYVHNFRNNSQNGEPMDLSNSSQPSSPMNSTFDSQHALRQAELGRQVQELSKVLALKEELANKMMQNEGAMNSKMIKQYEETVRELETEINTLETQKAEMATALAAAKSSVSTDGGTKARSRIKELEAKIIELKKKQVEQQKLYRLKQQSDSTVTKLNSEIQSMKTMRVKLMRQMKEESERFRNLKKEKEKEILQLKQQGRKRQFEYSKLQTMHKKQQSVLKRKTEEASAAHKRLRDALQKQKEASDKKTSHQSMQNKQAEGLLPRMKSWLGHEVEVLVSVHHAKRTLEEMIEDRKGLSRELSALRGQLDEGDDQPPTKKMLPTRGEAVDRNVSPELQARIKTMEADMKLRSIQVQELQQKILDAESVSGEKSKHRWNNIHTMAEAKAGLQALLQMTIDAKLKEIKLEKQVTANESDLKELQSLSEASDKRLRKEKDRLSSEHDEKVTTIREEHEEKVRILLQKIPSEEQKAAEERLRQEIIDKDKQLEELDVMNERITALQAENTNLKHQISDMVKVLENETPEPDEMEQEKSPQRSPSDKPEVDIEDIQPVVFIEDGEEEGDDELDDNVKDDPDWVETPKPTRHSSTTRLLQKKRESKALGDENGCGCKGKCKRNCKCRAAGELCQLHCKCRFGMCMNRPKDPTTPLLFNCSTDSDASTDELTKSPADGLEPTNPKPTLKGRNVLAEKDNQNLPPPKKPKILKSKASSNLSRLPFQNRASSKGWRTPYSQKSRTSSSSSDTDAARKTARRKSGVLSKKSGVKATSSRLFMSPHRAVLITPGTGFTPPKSAVPTKLGAKIRKPVTPKQDTKAEKVKKRKLHNPANQPMFMV